MPASVIIAPSGGRPKVSGKSTAIVTSGPTPGNTPMKVPSSTPAKQ
jgi:hypothetical protein